MKIGKVQKSCLEGLKERGGWCPYRSGWLWDTTSRTKRVMDSLVKRGLATVDESGTYRAIDGIEI